VESRFDYFRIAPRIFQAFANNVCTTCRDLAKEVGRNRPGFWNFEQTHKKVSRSRSYDPREGQAWVGFERLSVVLASADVCFVAYVEDVLARLLDTRLGSTIYSGQNPHQNIGCRSNATGEMIGVIPLHPIRASNVKWEAISSSLIPNLPTSRTSFSKG
jgi:hypothetical protein